MLYIQTPYIINLKRRIDRFETLEPKLKALFLPKGYEWFGAIEPKEQISQLRKGEEGCFLSHLALVKMAKQKSLPYIWIMEDDIDFTDYINFVSKLQYIYRLLPHNWDMLYLGGNHQSYVNIYKTDLAHHVAIATCSKIFTTHCYMINSSVYDEILQFVPYNRPIDVLYNNIHRRGYSFTAIPSLCYQIDSYSDVENCETRDRKIHTAIR